VKNLYLVGGGGHCRSCIDVIEQTGQYKILGIFDRKKNINKEVLGYKIIGGDEDLKSFIKIENYFLITLGQIKTPGIRKKIYDHLVSLNANLAIIISPRAYVSLHSSIGRGTIVMHDALVNAGVKVGENCIVNTKSLLEHDSVIHNHCHISTAAVINGDCIIEEGSYIGSNAVLKEGMQIPAQSIVSAGSFYRGK
jgi:sugar O-acyltransferase (sialic acid O-acetyltransferase NeuD family)